jgi:diaminopimelate decarboxylase
MEVVLEQHLKLTKNSDMEIQDVQKLINCKSYKTPCYIFKKKKLTNTLDYINRAIETKYNSIHLSYSYKTNSDKELLKVLKKKNICIEVVSEKEYKAVKKIGFKKVIYNGPAKSKKTLLDALKNNHIVNIENKRELSWLKSIELKKLIKIGIRVNFPLSDFITDAKNINSRFGFNLYEDLIKIIKNNKHIKIVGLHYHSTHMERSPEKFKIVAQELLRFSRSNNLDLDYIDIGGGFDCFNNSKYSFDDYMEAIYGCKEFDEFARKLTIIIEPGYGLINSCYDYLTKIVDIKKTKRGNFFLCDGSKLHLNVKSKINSFDVNFDKGIYTKRTKDNYIVGMSCMENDRLHFSNKNLLLKVNDRVLFKNCGAYTSSWLSEFILKKPYFYTINSDF